MVLHAAKVRRSGKPCGFFDWWAIGLHLQLDVTLLVAQQVHRLRNMVAVDESYQETYKLMSIRATRGDGGPMSESDNFSQHWVPVLASSDAATYMARPIVGHLLVDRAQAYQDLLAASL